MRSSAREERRNGARQFHPPEHAPAVGFSSDEVTTNAETESENVMDLISRSSARYFSRA
jgi:hypothetical protein